MKVLSILLGPGPLMFFLYQTSEFQEERWRHVETALKKNHGAFGIEKAHWPMAHRIIQIKNGTVPQTSRAALTEGWDFSRSVFYVTISEGFKKPTEAHVAKSTRLASVCWIGSGLLSFQQYEKVNMSICMKYLPFILLMEEILNHLGCIKPCK